MTAHRGNWWPPEGIISWPRTYPELFHPGGYGVAAHGVTHLGHLGGDPAGTLGSV